ncbi:MAG TPA: MBL fold metallo-hydrolase [Candidatus Korarchaeota archaeon]|nr:MBL fold metallo-hydrolase [Candidatus Korarchaeota archaeon]
MGSKILLDDFYELKPAENELSLLYLGYSGILIGIGGKYLLFDPADMLKGLEESLKKLDAVFYTHSHYDHFHLDSARSIFEATKAFFVAEESVYDEIREFVPDDKRFLARVGEFRVGDLNVSAVEGLHVGKIILFRLSSETWSLFHGGDSNYVPLPFEADVAILPTGRPSPTASPEAALKMALDLKPKVVVAFHGSDAQHKTLQKLLSERMPNVKFFAPEQGTPSKLSFR